MSHKLTVQEMISTLQKYWSDQGCMLMQSYDTEKGAGTMSPYTFKSYWTRTMERSLRGAFKKTSRRSLRR